MGAGVVYWMGGWMDGCACKSNRGQQGKEGGARDCVHVRVSSYMLERLSPTNDVCVGGGECGKAWLWHDGACKALLWIPSGLLTKHRTSTESISSRPESALWLLAMCCHVLPYAGLGSAKRKNPKVGAGAGCQKSTRRWATVYVCVRLRVCVCVCVCGVVLQGSSSLRWARV